MMAQNIPIFSFTCLLLFAIASGGCGSNSEVAKLTTRLATLEGEAKQHEARIKQAETELMSLRFEGDKTAYLSATDKGFSKVDTNNGWFLVLVSDIRPYADGQRVTLTIGNPLSMTFTGFKAKFKWGKRYEAENYKSYTDWSSALREKEFTFTESLRPSRWNSVQVNLAPAASDELGFLSVEMSTDQVRLFR